MLKILVKAILLFVIFNVLYYAVQPMNLLNRVSIYNVLVPGRLRLPFSEYPDESHNVTILDIDQMLASHEIAKPKAADEYRVVMIGDSAVWGYLLQPTETQAACLNKLGLTLPSGRKIHVYNLGYPKLTVVKDLLILRHALQYQPDLILWPITLASLYPSDQLDFPVITAQADELAALQAQYHFKLDQPLPTTTFWDRTFFGQRRALADWLRHQLAGFGWAATGVDHVVPRFLPAYSTSLVPSDNLYSVNVMHLVVPGKISPEDINLDVIKVGIQSAQAQGVPVLVVNEPMTRVNGSDQRYNTYYPKWAYDSYRDVMQSVTQREGWRYADFWDAEPSEVFTDTDLHMVPAATCDYAQKLSEPLVKVASGE